MGRKPKKTDAEQTENTEQQTEQKPELPFLKEPAEPGGVIIGTEDRDGTRPLTEEDLAAAREEQYKTALMLRDTQAREKDLATQEKRDEAQLKGTREQMRKAEEEALRLGDELATYAEEVHSGVRKIKFPAVLTLTKGNEVIVTDARDGKEIERRTASKEELEQGLFKDGALFGSKPSIAPATDHPMGKPVTVSIDAAAYTRTKKTIKESLLEVFGPNDDPDMGGHVVAWVAAGNGRSNAIVPTWVAHRLKEIASRDKALDFRIEGSDEDKVTVEVLKQ